jgi:IclR family pca regulon transcriptional regulator
MEQIAITISERPASPGNEIDRDDPAFVTSLARGLDVILAFGSGKPRMTISDVSKATGMSRAAARRFLFTLTALGYLKSDGRDYALAPKILSLSNTYIQSTPFLAAAHEVIEAIAARSSDACSLAVLDDGFATFIARAATRRLASTSLQVGSRVPAYCSSLGRVLLAGKTDRELDIYLGGVELRRSTSHTVTDAAELKAIIQKVRVDGYALLDQELETGLRSIAVPVTRPGGGVEAALGIASVVHTAEQLVNEHRQYLLRGASDLSARLAY